MNGKQAKRLRKEAKKCKLPPISYDSKQHLKEIPSGKVTPEGLPIPMVVASLQVVLSGCIRKVYKEYKKQYKGGTYVSG